jgi:Domain of unknown function (DUF4157)
MREHSPRPHRPQNPRAGGFSAPAPRRSPEAESAGSSASPFPHDFGRISVHTLGERLPQTRGTLAGQAPIYPASPVADRHGANAVTLGHAVHLSSALPLLETAEQQRILAHEAIHVAQHSRPGPTASRPELETEARQLTAGVLAGSAVEPRFHAERGMALADDGGPLPGDRIAVAKAKARREVLLRFKAIFEGSQGDVAAERKDILERRQRLDDSMQPRLDEIEKRSKKKGRKIEEYREQERKSLAQWNTRPLKLDVTKTAVKIRAQFQVRFEGLKDKEAAAKFPILERNLQKGIRDTWNQTLSGKVLPGRTFEVIPVLKLVPESAPRDLGSWLITVRPTDNGPMVYGSQSLGAAPGGIPTSVTDARLDGGVMSIPPSHITKPETLGHETLHLFALADRYAILPPQLTPTGTQEDVPLRNTKDRPDPLGSEGGTILEEDLGFVLDNLGVYPDITHREVLLELSQVEKIINTGRDPKSLIKKRKDFNAEVGKQAEDLD